MANFGQKDNWFEETHLYKAQVRQALRQTLISVLLFSTILTVFMNIIQIFKFDLNFHLNFDDIHTHNIEFR